MKHLFSLALVAFVSNSTILAESTLPVFTPLGDLPGGRFESTALSISSDGMRVNGMSSTAQGSQQFSWNATTGMVAVNQSDAALIANDIIVSNVEIIRDSQDGTFLTTAPVLQLNGSQPTRLTSAVSSFSLTGGTEGHTHLARAISSDGKWILSVAESFSTSQSVTGYVWNSNSIHSPETLTSLDGYSDITPDGTVLGYRFVAETQVPVILHSTGERETLGAPLDSWTHVQPTAISDSAQTIVGQATVAGKSQAFIWTRDQGYRLLSNLVTGDDGWTLIKAVDVSSDGLSIAGYGRNPSSSSEAWLVSLPSIGESLLKEWLTSHAIAASEIHDDFDDDGHSNLVEFVFDTNPLAPDSFTWTKALAKAYSDGGSVSLSLRQGSVKHISLSVQESSDLESWLPVSVAQVINENSVRIHFEQQKSSATFVRLAVQLKQE